VLTTDHTVLLATAFIANRIDYCNSVLFAAATTHAIRRLQMVMNAVARIVIIIIILFANNATACTSTSIQLRRAGQQGPIRTLTAGLKRLIKQLLGTYYMTQVKYYKQSRKLENQYFQCYS